MVFALVAIYHSSGQNFKTEILNLSNANQKLKFQHHSEETYSESCQTSKMERFAKTVKGLQAVTIFAKKPISYV